jgi:ribonuclease HII
LLLDFLLPNFSGNLVEAGADEAGRGCLAGPVTAAVVVLQPSFQSHTLNDSKKLTEKSRDTLRPILEKEALTFAVTNIYPDEIDEINILNASMKAMQECIIRLNKIPEFVIVDGNRLLNAKLGLKSLAGKIFSEQEIDFLKYLSIAAASVLAKTHRDEYMNKIHEEFPMYNWKKNKGYPTIEHREAIRTYGITKYHRKSFKLLPDQLELEL